MSTGRAFARQQPVGLVERVVEVDPHLAIEVDGRTVRVHQRMVGLPDAPQRRAQAGLAPFVRHVGPQSLGKELPRLRTARDSEVGEHALSLDRQGDVAARDGQAKAVEQLDAAATGGSRADCCVHLGPPSWAL